MTKEENKRGFSTISNGCKILEPDRIVAGYFVEGIWVPVTFETCINLIIAESKGVPLPATFERIDGFNAFGYIPELKAVGPLFNYSNER